MLEKMWGEQPPGIYCLSLKSLSGKWNDYFFKKIKSALNWLEENKDKGDLYFCTTTLSDSRRVKRYVQSSSYLWQDLDEVNPSLGKLKPTIAWQSSPGRYQALWKLDHPCKPKQIEALNKALAYKIGADQGSWILTKVLRIPGTLNHKYTKLPRVKLLWTDGPTFSPRKLEKILSVDKSEKSSEEQNGDSDYKEIYTKYRKLFSRKLKELLTAETAIKGKRSDMLWYLEHELVTLGLSSKEVYTLVKASVWNKFRGRDDEHIRLTEEIRKVIEEHEKKQNVVDLTKAETDEDKPVFSLSIQNDHELMTDVYQYPGWMVEGFWTRKSHGIIAGEPKSFKSTLALDMAVSVASGRKFLDSFEVIESGPVLMVQNENAPWIMKDRLTKIRANRNLVGEVTKHNGLYEVKFPKQLPLYYINQQGFSFNEPYHRKILDKVMKSIEPILVIFDPVYLMFDGDVNQSKDLNPILNWLLTLKDRYNCSIILIHHWKKGTQGSKLRGGQRMLGSTTLHGWIESAWYLDVKKSEELEDEIFSDELNSASGSATLTLEREFRGAGTYPKMDMVIKMGDFGSVDYSIELSRHKKERISVSYEEMKKSVIEMMEIRGGKVTMREIAKELGISRRTARRVLEELENA